MYLNGGGCDGRCAMAGMGTVVLVVVRSKLSCAVLIVQWRLGCDVTHNATCRLQQEARSSRPDGPIRTHVIVCIIHAKSAKCLISYNKHTL